MKICPLCQLCFLSCSPIFYLFVQLGKVYGIESHVLGPKESKELYPLLNSDDLYGTLYSPGDGTIDPAGWASSLARGATRRGAKVRRPYWKVLDCS